MLLVAMPGAPSSDALVTTSNGLLHEFIDSGAVMPGAVEVSMRMCLSSKPSMMRISTAAPDSASRPFATDQGLTSSNKN